MSGFSNKFLIVALMLAWLAVISPVAFAEDTDDGFSPPGTIIIEAGIEEEGNSEPAIEPDSIPSSGSTSPYAQEEPVILPSDSKISISEASDLSIEAIGIQPPERLGLPPLLWQKTPRERLENLLSTIQSGMAASTPRDLLGRLLLAKADYPRPTDPNSDLLTLRVKALLALGKTQNAAQLMQLLPASFDTEKLAQLRTDIALLQGSTKGICDEVNAKLERYDTLYWQNLLTFCQALKGQREEAEISLSLMAEQHGRNGGFMPALVNAMLQDSPKTPFLHQPLTLMDYAFALNATMSQENSDWFENAPLPIWLAASRQPDISIGAKARLLESLVLHGAAPVNELNEAYGAFKVEEKELSSLKDSAGAKTYENALLYLKAQEEKDLFEKLKIMSKAMQVMEKQQLRPLALRLYKEEVRAISAEPLDKKLLPFTPLAISILLAGDEIETAAKWIGLMETYPEAASSFQFSMTKAILALARKNSETAILLKKVNLPDKAKINDIRRYFRLHAMTDALGYKQEAGSINALVAPRLRYEVEMPPLALVEAFDQAQAMNDVGGTLLLGALLTGNGSLARLSDTVLADVIRTWMRLGMKKEAYGLALESLLAIDG